MLADHGPQVRIVGSVHTGRVGDFRTKLVVGSRACGTLPATDWEFASVPLDGPTDSRRLMGLATTPTGLVAVAGSTSEAYLATLDHDLEQVGWHELPDVYDPHSVVADGDHLWVVSSGTNRIVRYELSADGPRSATTVYSHPGGTDDPQHFNGLTMHEGRLILSAFGTSTKDVRHLRGTGYLTDISDGTQLYVGLNQPHSPHSNDGSLLFCESRSSLVRRDETVFARLDGYLRGMSVSHDGILHVAESAARAPAGEPNGSRGDASIWSLAPDGSVLSRHPLTGLGAEVYDLVTLSP